MEEIYTRSLLITHFRTNSPVIGNIYQWRKSPSPLFGRTVDPGQSFFSGSRIIQNGIRQTGMTFRCPYVEVCFDWMPSVPETIVDMCAYADMSRMFACRWRQLVRPGIITWLKIGQTVLRLLMVFIYRTSHLTSWRFVYRRKWMERQVCAVTYTHAHTHSLVHTN